MCVSAFKCAPVCPAPAPVCPAPALVCTSVHLCSVHTGAHCILCMRPCEPKSLILRFITHSRFQAKPATLSIPIDFPFLFMVEELYGTQYQSGSFSLINGGVKACVFIYFFLFSGRQKPARHQDYCSYICGGCIQCLICMIFVADSIACRLHF